MAVVSEKKTMMDNTALKNIDVSSGKLAYYDLGEGQAVVLLHGFPDTPHTFENMVSELVNAGFRCIVPFMPGYGGSSLPQKTKGLFKGVQEASMLGIGRMLDEMLQSILPGEAIKIIGHDWGSLVAQVLVALNDEDPQPSCHIERAIFYAVPPIGSFYKNISFKQIYRSRYMYYFQLPGVAKIIRDKQLEYIKTLWQRWSPWSSVELKKQAQLDRTLKTLEQGACLENGMAYYRSLLNPYYMIRGSSIIEQNRMLFKKRSLPCLLLVGEKDECIGREMFQGGTEYYPHPDTRFMEINGLGHFAHLENPEKVAALVLDYFKSEKATLEIN